MFKSAKRLSVAAVLAALAIASFGTIRADDDDLLTIGSDAPALNIEHWVQDGGGKFKPVTKFEAGKVYIVEFWATWCGPCITSMPHLAKLQQDYADQGVQLISISDEDLETVEAFLKRPVRGQEDEQEEKTYRDVTNAYCLTTDPDQSSSEDYMRAAGQINIPTSFIVGKDSKIEWIGHPAHLEETLKAVVSDSWDRDAFAAEFKAEQEAKMLGQKIEGLVRKQEFDEALQLIDKLAENNDGLPLKMMKFQVLRLANRSEDLLKHVNEIYESIADDPAIVNVVAWNLYEMGIEDEALVAASIAAVEKAGTEADAEVKASILDTLAHYVFKQGDLDKAIELETEAAKLSGDQDREFIENFLEELKSLKKEKESGTESE